MGLASHFRLAKRENHPYLENATSGSRGASALRDLFYFACIVPPSLVTALS